MAASTDQILDELHRMEARQDERHMEMRKSLADLHGRVDSLESERDKRHGAQKVLVGLVGAGAASGVWAWFTELFKHGGK